MAFSQKEQRVVTGEIESKFDELVQTSVCLFATRKACADFNVQILKWLLLQLKCTDEVDETNSKGNWSKKAAEHLKKLNDDCNSKKYGQVPHPNKISG